MKENFTAEQGKEWLMGGDYAGNKVAASKILDDLLAARFIELTASCSKIMKGSRNIELLTMIADVSHPEKKMPLNAAFRWSGQPRPASKVRISYRKD